MTTNEPYKDCWNCKVNSSTNKYDSVNHPSHYCEGRKYEPIDVIEDWNLDFYLGNTVKYISRAGRKDDILQDLQKARWYIERKIRQLEEKEVDIKGDEK